MEKRRLELPFVCLLSCCNYYYTTTTVLYRFEKDPKSLIDLLQVLIAIYNACRPFKVIT